MSKRLFTLSFNAVLEGQKSSRDTFKMCELLSKYRKNLL